MCLPSTWLITNEVIDAIATDTYTSKNSWTSTRSTGKKSWSNSGRCISSLLPCESWMHRHSLNLNRKWEPIVYFINKLAHCGWFYDNRCPGTRSRFRGKSIGFRGIRRFAIYFKTWKRFGAFFSINKYAKTAHARRQAQTTADVTLANIFSSTRCKNVSSTGWMQKLPAFEINGSVKHLAWQFTLMRLNV